ncbi:hypothetical protein MRX96_058321 [Rhipicephalus microplus]
MSFQSLLAGTVIILGKSAWEGVWSRGQVVAPTLVGQLASQTFLVGYIVTLLSRLAPRLRLPLVRHTESLRSNDRDSSRTLYSHGSSRAHSALCPAQASDRFSFLAALALPAGVLSCHVGSGSLACPSRAGAPRHVH